MYVKEDMARNCVLIDNGYKGGTYIGRFHTWYASASGMRRTEITDRTAASKKFPASRYSMAEGSFCRSYACAEHVRRGGRGL